MADTPNNTVKPAGQTPLVGLTKRQQLDQTNRNIFIWVAIAGGVVALSLVLLQFLVKEALFNQKIITAQQKTVDTLEQNLTNAPKLKKNVDALLASNSLALLRANAQDSTLQVILDALPTTGDATTFSNSLYNRVLVRTGVQVSAVSVGTQNDPSAALAPAPIVADGGSSAPTPQPLPYAVTFNGTQAQVTDTLVSLEKVIRPISTKKMTVNASGNSLLVNLTGETYFMPKSTIDLGKTSIKP